ncbi:unnamed protein product [Lactuca saligna]|uniref:Uncharacterized protein n=1 Tax=Lactuca saligna TaxID=75948 RepID=A0AA35UUB2_LACSI|nr:unnamed protein product [Lactuca saligna]
MNSENSRWKSDDVWNKDFHFNGVDKRNRFQSKRDQYHLRYDSQSFYITNFPKTILPSDLWCDCGCLVRGQDKGNKELDNVAMGNKEPVNVAIVLNSGDFIIRNKKLAYLAKARDFSTLSNLRMLCHDEGFVDFQIRYAWGLWVMF